MDSGKRFKNGIRRTLILLMKTGILFVSLAVFAFVYFQYYSEANFYFKGDVIFMGLYMVLLYFFLHTYDAFKIGSFRYRDLVFAYAIGTFFTDFITYFLLSLFALKLLSPWPLIISMLLLWCISIPGYRLMQKAYRALYPAISALAVCADGFDRRTASKFSIERTRFVVADIVEERLGMEAILEKADRHQGLVMGRLDRDVKERLLEYAFLNHKDTFIIPSIQEVISNSAIPLIVDDSLVYLCRSHDMSADTRALKRVADICIAALLALITSPLMLLSAILIKAYDKGPILLRQTRLTMGGRAFTLYKFRSMIVDAEKETGAVLSRKGEDDRITRVGRFLRASHFDELPQLFNVLKGDMSMVGPRPERPELYERICKELPEFRYRLAVKAGLTGYAQLYGRYETSFADKVRLDLYYIENATALMDLQLMIYTIKDIFKQ